MTFARLRGADWIALLAALALLLVSAMDWYSTVQGEELRRQQQRIEDLPPVVEEDVGPQTRFAAEAEESNAWQADALIDRLLLIGLLATVAATLAAAFLRAAGRRFEPPRTPSAATALLAAVTALLACYRIIQEPGLDVGSTVQAGAPLAIALLGAIALASAIALRHEETGTAIREPAPEAVAEEAPPTEQSAP